MTAVIAWLNKEKLQNKLCPNRFDEELWVIADGLVTYGEQDASQNRAESYLKIFPISVRCTDISGNPCGETYFSQNIGMAFAGQDIILTSNMIVWKLSVLLSLLDGSKEKADKPDLKAIADLAQKISENVIVEREDNSKKICGQWQAILFGYCSKSKGYRLFHLKPSWNDQIQPSVALDEKKFSSDEDVFCIGSKESDIKKWIREKRGNLTRGSKEWWRAPEEVLREVIKDNKIQGIGGEITISVLQQNNLIIYCTKLRSLVGLSDEILKSSMGNMKIIPYGYRHI